MGNFTVDKGIEVQTKDLEKWKLVLKTKYYFELKKWATETNGQAKTGYDVRRGTDLTSFVYKIMER